MDRPMTIADPYERAAALIEMAGNSDQHPLERVWAADRAAGVVADLLRISVDRARDEGATWHEVGDQLGISSQAAWNRFHE